MEFRFSSTVVRHNSSGFSDLIRLHNSFKDAFIEEVVLNLAGVTWFDADMCAPLGAILYKIGSELNTIKLVNVDSGVQRILSKNGFLSHYGGEVLPDTHRTTVSYQRFDLEDDRYFGSYIETQLLQRSEIPKMSARLIKKFTESVFELFSNAVIHSETRLGIFSCGQFYPRGHCLDFSVADLGVGIKNKVNARTSLGLDAVPAILWATDAKNTTKVGPIPGGLGLKLLKDFILINGGRIQIVSDSGYWCYSSRGTETQSFEFPYPGTVVHLEINTADTNSYVLSSELSEKDIF